MDHETKAPGRFLGAAFAIAAPYGFLLSTLNLKTFWSTAGVDPFQHANPAELVLAGLGGMAVFLMGLVGGIAAGIVIGRRLPDPNETALRWIPVILTVGFVATASLWLYLFWVDSPSHWLLIGVGLNFFVVAQLAKSTWVRARMPNGIAIAVVAALIAYFPCASVYYGLSAGKRAISAESGRLIDMALSDIGPRITGNALFVGSLGNLHVIYLPGTGTTVLVKAETTIAFRRPPASTPTAASSK